MLRALRRCRLVSLVSVFVLFTVMPASLPLWHDEGDDPFCSPQLVVHDHSAHRIDADDSSSAAPEHCLLCHWAQSFRIAISVSRIVLPAAPSVPLLRTEVFVLSTTLVTGPSGRAPPALL